MLDLREGVAAPQTANTPDNNIIIIAPEAPASKPEQQVDLVAAETIPEPKTQPAQQDIGTMATPAVTEPPKEGWLHSMWPHTMAQGTFQLGSVVLAAVLTWWFAPYPPVIDTIVHQGESVPLKIGQSKTFKGLVTIRYDGYANNARGQFTVNGTTETLELGKFLSLDPREGASCDVVPNNFDYSVRRKVDIASVYVRCIERISPK